MDNNKKWYVSLTIISQIIIMALIGLSIWMTTNIKTLSYDFTTEQLCNWAYATSQNQRIVVVQMLIISLSLLGIYGRIRAKKNIGGKSEK